MNDPLDSWWPYIVSLVVGLVTCIRSYMGGATCPTDNRIEGKLVIVTGASSGIGLETCKELAKRGGNIIMCCRSIQSGKDAMAVIRKKVPKAKLTLKRVDMSSMKSVTEFANCIGENQVDVLINNAGIVHHPYHKTEEGHDIHLATNYLGHFLLTHLLLKNLRKAHQGRIINVCAGSYQSVNLPLTCEAEKNTYAKKEWFAQSKLALILMTKHLNKLLEDTKVTINALNPGMVRGTKHLRQSVIMRNWSVKVSLGPWMWIFMKSPAQGAQTSIYLATDPLLAHTSGKFYNDCTEEETTGSHSNNMDAASELYDRTHELLGTVPFNVSKGLN